MEKFVIDLDKVLNDFEFNEDCAEQITSVATTVVDTSTIEKHATESTSPKTYNCNSEESIDTDVIPSFEKHKDTKPIDSNSKYLLAEKNLVSTSCSTKDSINNFYTHDCISDNKIGQKSCVHSSDSDPIYKDISYNLMQKQQNGNSDVKDDNRYDKKLNQPNFKPSISNVFNSLNEYINAPTGSLDYVEPILDKKDLTKVSSVTEDFIATKDATIDHSTSKGKKIDLTGKNILDYRTVLPELNMFIKIDAEDKRDNTMQSVTPQHFTMIKSEKCNTTTIPTSNIAISKQEHDAVESTEPSDKIKRRENNDALKFEKIRINQVPEISEEKFQEKIKNCPITSHTTNEKTMDNNGRFEASSENIVNKQKQLNLMSQSSIDKYTFIKNKDSITENTTSLNTNTTNSKNHNENMKTSKVCDISSNVHVNPTTSDNFSEEELNRYLLELEEEEEKCKTQGTSRSDDTWSLKQHDKLENNKAKTVNQRHEDINDASKFEKIRINQVPEITEEEFQEKIKNFSKIYHGTNTCNENVINVQCDDTLKVALNEKSKQLQNTQSNELDKTIRENDISKIADQDVVVQESILQDIAIEETTTLKFENAEEQYNSNVDVTRNLQKNINTDIRSQDNTDNAVENFSENKEDCAERIHCQDITENNKDIPTQYDNRTHDGANISKTEIIYKIADADCTVSHTNENNEEAEGKVARPHTLDIVLPHKNDSLECLSVTPGEPEQSGTRVIVDEDRGAASDVSDNSLIIECNTVLGKQPPFWVPDSDAPSCMLCDVKFTVLKRRHHCRACGKVLCNKCCNMKFRLEYQGNIDSRVCVSCYDLLTKADSEQGMSDWSTEYNSHANCSDVNSSQGRQPNPNNPMEYCSTIPPLQQLAGSLPPPPTVMVPVGVLKREGSKHRTEGQKSVMFSDGIRPGCDLTELDTCWDPKPPYRKQGNKRIFTSGSMLTDTATRRQSHPPLDNVTNSYIPHNPNLLPPTVTIHKGQITYHLSMDESALYKMMQNECEPPVMFAINRNLYAYVKITNLNCCVNKICWNVTSRGLACVGQDEVILLVEVLPDETRIPKDLLIYINQLYLEAIKGNTMTELGFSIYQGSNLLGSREHTGFLFIRQTLQCLQKIILPPAPFLIGLLIHRWETPWARVFPLRLLLRLGAEYRYYPCPLVSVRFRDALYFEIGHTVMKVLADFRNFGYTLPGVKGLTIHLKNRTTDVMFPKNRYDQVIKGLHNSNDHVLAYASNFSIAADSHLVCIQTNTGDESNYQTQAINIHNRPRTVTGASFIVINGALKSSMGLSAKSSIVEDGLMVEIMPEKMEALKAALKNMQDFSIGCGHQGASEPDETVNIKWVDNDVQFNLGVKSPIDGQLMDGIPSIRVHNGTDYKGATRFIRWTEVFIIKSDDHLSGVNDPVDINKLSGNIAKATCLALVKLLDLLATAGLTKLGVRATIHLDNVGYEAGSEGTKLPPIYMKSLDNELIQVLHKAAQSSQDAHTVLELIFYILED